VCGIVGIATTSSQRPLASDSDLARMRDTMAHRGPDGSGLLTIDNVTLAHRRLAVIDPTPSGAQPMTRASRTHRNSTRDRWAITYNGELYNEPDLRLELERGGETLDTACDTETLLATLARQLDDPAWNRDDVRAALASIRGMYAFALYDAHAKRLLLARDPLGVKPIYWSNIASRELVFASEQQAILAHPSITPEPDPHAISAYLTTIRTTLGTRTLFKGIRALPPGHALIADLSGDDLRCDVFAHWRGPRSTSFDGPDPVHAVRSTITDSVQRHLRADVPTCALLSGGLDSTITSSIARDAIENLRTYCSGAPSAASDDDISIALRVARALNTHHSTAPITQDLFIERWSAMVSAMGVPLSTPNEVAINEVARRLRADGCIVTISGEGADELFAGYDTILDAALADLASPNPLGPQLYASATAWVPSGAKHALLRPEVWRTLNNDAALLETCTSEFAAACDEAGTDGLPAHARMVRRINLTGLLTRLDSATMLASVEGRTPFADAQVASLAESLDLALSYAPPDTQPNHTTGGVATATATRTKRILREAFAPSIPEVAATRAKASFPLPFQAWMGIAVPHAPDSSLLREWFNEGALYAAAADPSTTWRLAWPLANLALWSRRWWG
jgi:asparagine synthase (glutamine-hydrolysing)